MTDPDFMNEENSPLNYGFVLTSNKGMVESGFSTVIAAFKSLDSFLLIFLILNSDVQI
jgi:hypothetical protein